MYLNKLSIFENYPQKNLIREIPFKRGLNFIVDNSEDHQEHGNNVGKTTVLKIIDLCFGARNRNILWYDNDTGSINKTLKDYLSDSKVYAELEMESDMDGPNNNILSSNGNGIIDILRVDLFDNGKRYINDEKYNYNDYKTYLNKIVFQNHESKPTLRELIGKFIRIGQSAESGNILKYLHQTVSNADYTNIYNYLFDLASSEISAQILQLTKEINKKNNSLQDLIRLHNFINIDDLDERINIVTAAASTAQQKIDILLEHKFTEESFKKRDLVESYLLKLDEAIDKTSFEINKIKKIIYDLKSKKSNVEIDYDLLQELFDETKQEFKKVTKTFDELVQFNQTMSNNKLEYYEDKLYKSLNLHSQLLKRRTQIVRENKEIFEIINNDKFKDFDDIYSNLIYQNQLLGELKKVKEIYINLLDSIKLNTKTLLKLEATQSANDHLSKFNEFFIPLSYSALNQRLYLTKNDSGFPLKISNVEDGLGTGNKKAITLLLDIAYVSFIDELNLKFPKFFIHDVLETVDQSNFKVIVDTINSNGSQFITAVLREKIDSYDFIKEDDISLELSIDDRLFKIPSHFP